MRPLLLPLLATLMMVSCESHRASQSVVFEGVQGISFVHVVIKVGRSSAYVSQCA